MRPLIIDEEATAKIKAMVAHAEANIFTMDDLLDIFNKQGFYMQVNRPGIEQTAEFKWLTRRFFVSASYKFGKLEISNKSKLPGTEGGAE